MAGLEKVFLSIGRIGKLDEKGKTAICYTFKGRAEANRDEFLTAFIPGVVHALLGHLGHTSFAAAQQDLENMKREVAEMKLLPNVQDTLKEAIKHKTENTKPKRSPRKKS